MPPQAIESPTKHTHTESTSCLCCKGDMLTQRNILDHDKCVGNRLVQQIEADNLQLKQYIVCDKCFKKIQNENNVHCNSCGRTDIRRKMVINRNKGDIAVTHSMYRSSITVPHTNGYICSLLT